MVGSIYGFCCKFTSLSSSAPFASGVFLQRLVGELGPKF